MNCFVSSKSKVETYWKVSIKINFVEYSEQKSQWSINEARRVYPRLLPPCCPANYMAGLYCPRLLLTIFRLNFNALTVIALSGVCICVRLPRSYFFCIDLDRYGWLFLIRMPFQSPADRLFSPFSHVTSCGQVTGPLESSDFTAALAL